MCSCYLVVQWNQPVYRVALICKLVQFQDVLKKVTLDVLCRQPIKLFQVVSTSEFHEY